MMENMWVKKLITVRAEMAQRIENFRFGHRIGAESEALRRLIEIGLREAEREDAARSSGDADV